MSDAPMAVPIRAAQPVRKTAVEVTHDVAATIGAAEEAPSPRSEQMRALAQRRWSKPAVHAGEHAENVVRIGDISKAVTTIAAALEPLTHAERQKAVDAVLVLMG